MSLLDVWLPTPLTPTSRKDRPDDLQPYILPFVLTTTPEDSPASMLSSSNQESCKKVEFCAQPDVYNATVFATSPEQAASIKALPPSREHRGSRRSILKPSSQAEVHIQSTGGQQDDKLSINEHMDSIVQQLSKNDKSTSIDAYNSIASLFRAYDELPEAIVLKNKLTTLIKYISRDLGTQDQADDDPTDTNLILSALKLLIILVWNTTFAPLLSDEAKTFILDRSIHVIAEHRASKNIIAHYLHLLSTQTFRPQLMTANNRAGRLLDALKELPIHVSSSAVMSETIMVLSRLTDQARPVMRFKADCWAEMLFKTMITSSRDTRQKAVSFGIKACSAFATVPSVSAAFREMLRHETDTKMTLELVACKCLKGMIAEPENAVLVPQIWTIVLLLTVHNTVDVHNWISPGNCWLEVIQKCFNSSDTALRIQANFAWNRFVCLACLHQGSDHLASQLGKPVAAQMVRCSRYKQSHGSRTSALSTYCNLLYYAFRPAATHKEYTRSWNEYVVKVLRSSFFERSVCNADFACRIFMALMWNSTRVTKVWKDTRAHDNSTVEPEELPTVDAKWIRKNCGTVLQMFKLLFSYSTWSSSRATSNQHCIAGPWKSFAKSLGFSASKEIKASSETVQACAQVVNFLQDLWIRGPRSVNATDERTDILAERLSFLLSVVIAELGAAPFADAIDIKTVSLPAAVLQTFAATAVEMRHLGHAHLAPKSDTMTILLLEKTLCLLDKRLHSTFTVADVDQHDLRNMLELLSACSRDAPQSVKFMTLQTMQSSLYLWLEDPGWSSTEDEVTGIARLDTAIKVAEIIVPSLGEVPHSMIENLDGLFAGGFTSTHKYTIDLMVHMWNRTHGQASPLAYGRLLPSALARLEPYVDIELADMNLRDDVYHKGLKKGTAPPSFLAFSENQSQLVVTDVFEETREILEHSQKQTQSTGNSIIEESSGAVLLPNNLETATMSQPQSSHSTPQRRLRHNEPPVHFEPTDSSPLNEMQESFQCLTEQQDEFHVRQRQDMTVHFSDHNAEVESKLVHSAVHTLGLGRRALSDEQQPSTPVLLDRDLPTFDTNHAASPTPRSKHQALRLEDIEAPSSPLSMQADEEIMAQEVLGGDHQQEEGVEVYNHIPVEENTRTEDQPVARLTELQRGSPVQRRAIDEEAKDACQPEPAVLLNEVVQTENSVIQSEDEYDIEADATTHEAREAEMSSMHNQSELPTIQRSPVAIVPRRLDSDELDMMSQSQLSQDLELHVSEYGNTPEPTLAMEDKVPDQPSKSSPAPTVVRRKRKLVSRFYAGSKRRKSRAFSLSPSTASENEAEQTSDDCIEVETSSRLPLMEVWASKQKSQPSASLPTIASRGNPILETGLMPDIVPLRGTGTDGHTMVPPAPATRPPAFQLSLSDDHMRETQATSEPSPDQLTAAIKQPETITQARNTVSPLMQESAEHMQSMVVSRKLIEAASKDAVVQTTVNTSTDAASGTEDNAARTRSVRLQNMSAPTYHAGVQAEADITTSLRDVLRRLETSNGEGLDLRAIDDLCFHIRTESQNALSRSLAP